MAPIEREDRSFIGCGEEEYPKGSIVSRTAPVGVGIHGEVLPHHVEMRLQYGDLMDGKPGVGGEEYRKGDAEPFNASAPKIPTRADLIRILKKRNLPTVDLYIDGLIREKARQLAGADSGERFDYFEKVMLEKFSFFWRRCRDHWDRVRRALSLEEEKKMMAEYEKDRV